MNKPALAGDPVPEVASTSAPAVGSTPWPKESVKKSSFEELLASIEEPGELKTFSVKIPAWLRKAVVARIKEAQGKGLKLTQDLVVKNALMAYFDLEEPE